MLPQFTLGYKLTFAWESVLQAISTQGDLLPQKTCFTTDPKDSRGPVFRRSPPTHYDWGYSIQKGKVNGLWGQCVSLSSWQDSCSHT